MKKMHMPSMPKLATSKLSATSMSLEKRARMRPSGVVSKKAWGACRMVLSSCECKRRLARMPITDITSTRMKAKTAAALGMRHKGETAQRRQCGSARSPRRARSGMIPTTCLLYTSPSPRD